MLSKPGRRSIHMASKKVLVLNAGSSSLKFKLFDEAKIKLVASVSGLIERIGDTSNSQVTPHAQRFHVYAVTSYCNTPSFQLLPVLLVPSLMYPPSVKFEHTINAHSCYIRMPTTCIAGHLLIVPAALQLVGNILSGDNKGKSTHKEGIKDHTAALDVAMNYLQDSYSKSVREQVHAIGHRVVHGKDVGKAMLVTAEIEKLIKDAADLAPLHNPANMQGISAAKSIFPGQPQVNISHASSLSLYMLLLKHSFIFDRGIQLVCNIPCVQHTLCDMQQTLPAISNRRHMEDCF